VPLLRLGALLPRREVKLLPELLLPSTHILVVAERMLLASDPDPSTFLNERDSSITIFQRKFLQRRKRHPKGGQRNKGGARAINASERRARTTG